MHAPQERLLAERLTAVRECHDDVELLPQQPAQFVLGLGEPACCECRPLGVERKRLALRQRRQFGRPGELDRLQALLRPDGLHLVERPHEVGRPVEGLHQICRRLEHGLFPSLRPEVDLDELASPLGGREDRRLFDRPQGSLCER